MTDIHIDKAAARKAGFAARAMAHDAMAANAPAALQHHLEQALADKAPGVVSGYLPIRSEIDPRPTMARLHTLGHRICVPVIQGKGLPLRFREWHPDSALVAGPFGAKVPQAGDWIQPNILLCPLVAYDDAFYRMGYGGGFYDRTLEQLRAQKQGQVLAIGVAYSAQSCAAVPTEPTDQPMDAIATEQGVIWRTLANPANPA